jgi:hypothetical protein
VVANRKLAGVASLARERRGTFRADFVLCKSGGRAPIIVGRMSDDGLSTKDRGNDFVGRMSFDRKPWKRLVVRQSNDDWGDGRTTLHHPVTLKPRKPFGGFRYPIGTNKVSTNQSV